MLTELAARRAEPRDRDYRLADADGLHLFVTTKGHRSWRCKYRFGGKERPLVLGAYPEVGLKSARELRDDAKATLGMGRDPALGSKRARNARKGRPRRYVRDLREGVARAAGAALAAGARGRRHTGSMEKNLFPVIGAYPAAAIDEDLMLAALWPYERRGALV